MKSLQEIEIISSKIDNPKYKEKHEEYTKKLEDEKDNRKHLQAGYNWYLKLLSERQNKKYVKQKFQLDKPTIDVEKVKSTEYIPKPIPRPIDYRTGKEVEKGELYRDKTPLNKLIEAKAKAEDKNLHFEKDGDVISLSKKYFDDKDRILTKYIPKLMKKGIVLKRKHYMKDDYNEYIDSHFYGIKGYGLIKI